MCVLGTHDIEVIRAMVHRVMEMKDGQVVEAGCVEQMLLPHPQSDFTKELMLT